LQRVAIFFLLTLKMVSQSFHGLFLPATRPRFCLAAAVANTAQITHFAAVRPPAGRSKNWVISITSASGAQQLASGVA
jgi:hypothetical protein